MMLNLHFSLQVRSCSMFSSSQLVIRIPQGLLHASKNTRAIRAAKKLHEVVIVQLLLELETYAMEN